MCSDGEPFALADEEDGVVCLTEPGCRLNQRIEHQLQVERRVTDDLEHVGGGGLLLQRLTQFIQQPRVLMAITA